MNSPAGSGVSSWRVSAECGLQVLKVDGPERLDFLQRLLTNDLKLAPGQGCCAYFLNVQGRPLVQFGVYETGSNVWLVVEKAYAERAFRELDLLHFGEKLKIHPKPIDPLLHLGPPSQLCAQLDAWACSNEWLNIPYFGGQAYLQLPTADQVLTVEPSLAEGASLASSDELRELRFRALAISLEQVPEKTLFLEIASSTDYSETKGCYPGQEVVARTLHRGHINKHLVLLEGPDQVLPEVGSPLLGDSGTAVGSVLASCRTHSGSVLVFAIVRRGHWDAGTELRNGESVYRVIRGGSG